MFRNRERLKRMKLQLQVAITTIVAVCPLGATAGVTKVSYDALGRLVQICNATPGSGDLTKYEIDKAANRITYSNARTDLEMSVNNGLYSANQRTVLYMQADGNLVVYLISAGTWSPLWATNTAGSGACTPLSRVMATSCSTHSKIFLSGHRTRI